MKPALHFAVHPSPTWGCPIKAKKQTRANKDRQIELHKNSKYLYAKNANVTNWKMYRRAKEVKSSIFQALYKLTKMKEWKRNHVSIEREEKRHKKEIPKVGTQINKNAYFINNQKLLTETK